MKATVKEKAPYHYIPHYEFVRFIEANSEMNGVEADNYAREHRLIEGGILWWSKEDLSYEQAEEDYGEHVYKWVWGFFEAHPWISRMMVVFEK